MQAHERFKDYTDNMCWQAHIRRERLDKDLNEAGLDRLKAAALRTSDFDFSYVDKTDKEGCREIKEFIQHHEWLGKLPNRPTHRFIVRHRESGLIAGATIMATPNAFSHLLGKENRDLEKLISRGACISWSPKNLGSFLTMQAIKWMVRNTDFRIFTAYSDPEAKELGTIYQACNFYYLGQTSGTNYQYLDPAKPERGWFSDREFRKRSKYKLYATKIGIEPKEWEEKYMGKWSPDWTKVPKDIKIKIKAQEKKYRESCEKRKVPTKHKYCYILGRSKKETKQFRRLFRENNFKKVDLPYPRERGK